MEHKTTITGKHFKAVISSLGAELKSVQHQNGTEFMWQANPDIWPRTAPVLFPIVGKVKNDVLKVEGKTYPISQHGFARDKQFSLVQQTAQSVTYQLLYSDETLQKFPFDFKLLLSYTWDEDTLICGYEVHNLGVSPMPFSIGAHPGFNIPDGDMSQCSLVFNHIDLIERHVLEGGLFNGQKSLIPLTDGRLPLNATLFDDDAIVLKNTTATMVKLEHKLSGYGVKMDFSGFPQLGIWAKKGTQRFICLEPWFGYADATEGHQDMRKKDGVQTLPPHQVFNASYALTFSV